MSPADDSPVSVSYTRGAGDSTVPPRDGPWNGITLYLVPTPNKELVPIPKPQPNDVVTRTELD